LSNGRKYFVDIYKQSLRIKEHLLHDNSVKRAGFAGVEILKTPLGHRVVISAIRLGMIIGKSGRNIKRLTDELETLYALESPQLEVKELESPDLVARVQADKLLSQIERGFHFRRAAHALIRRIMASGARGVEIIISGKLSSQRARSEAFREGFVAKAGLPAQRYVDEAVAHSILKQGIIGIKVRIMSPEADLPDEPIFYESPFGDEDTSLAPIAPIKEKPLTPEEISSEEEMEEEGELEKMEKEFSSTPTSEESILAPVPASNSTPEENAADSNVFKGDYEEEDSS
jgi:small subunit ribosomal protein S3